MPKIYSEVGAARIREILADVSTLIWVILWVTIGIRVNDSISSFAEAGRVLQGGGDNIQSAGAQLGDVLRNVPLVGGGIDDLTTGAFGSAGAPFVAAGQEVEEMVVLVARLLAFLVVAVFVVPWLFKYLPWRSARLSTLRAAHLAIRRAADRGVRTGDAAGPRDPRDQSPQLPGAARAHGRSVRRLRGRSVRRAGQGRAGERRAALRRSVP